MRRMTERPLDPASRAAIALAARRRQIHTLRLPVTVLALSIFLAAWATVFVRLGEGHDPALASTAATVLTPSADPEAASDDTTNSDTAAAAPATVTTRQS